jgi:hypothetical protein
MPLGLSFKQNSLYNYGGISPNNLILYHSTYNPIFYRSTGGYFGTGSTWYDLSFNNNNSTLTNIGYSGALSFNGIASSTGGYTMSSDLYPYLNSSSFNETQEVWFRNSYYNQSGTNGVIISLLGQNIPNTGYHHSNFEISGKTGYVGFYVTASSSVVSTVVDTYTNGNWNHMAWTYSGTLLSVYSNGVKKNTLTINRFLPSSNYYASLGTSETIYMYSGGYYRGLIGSYKIYNRSLTDSEILQNYNYERRFFSVLTQGNATTTMTTTGLTSLAGVIGQDDAAATIPGINFDFYFFGTNYGNGLNLGIYWSSNNVLGFGNPDSTISWTATTGKGVLIGNLDRRTNNFYYSTTQSSSGYSYLNCLLFAQNIYNDGIANAVQFQLRFFRGPASQYIEVRCKQAPSTAGVYNITNGSAFQNTYGAFTNMVANQSYVLESDLNGNNWTFYNNYYINL